MTICFALMERAFCELHLANLLYVYSP